MNNSIPLEIKTLLNKYVELLISEFGGAIYGVYIYGSLATGCFDAKTSDIDFMTFLKKDLNENDIKRIQSIHETLKKFSAYGYLLEGEYVSFNDIKCGIPSGQFPYFAFGKFQGFVGLKSFAWFQLKERGITYYGADFRSISGDIDWKIVRKELISRLDIYWPSVINWKLIFFDRWLALVVLSVCRIYYSLENKSTISKDGGGEYALLTLGTQWHLLINEALRIQKNSSKKSLFESKIERLNKTKEFVRYISETYSTQYDPVVNNCYKNKIVTDGF